ncbi:MAG: hypothetical protein GOV00_00460 [Candidatus Altiarchaeota archaeon]|nr:hypothetical protein [Candidatus Altiarchaeota archaeon]
MSLTSAKDLLDEQNHKDANYRLFADKREAHPLYKAWFELLKNPGKEETEVLDEAAQVEDKESQLSPEKRVDFMNLFEAMKNSHIHHLKERVARGTHSENPYKMNSLKEEQHEILTYVPRIIDNLEWMRGILTKDGKADNFRDLISECIGEYEVFPEPKAVEKIKEIQAKKSYKKYYQMNTALAKTSAKRGHFGKANTYLELVRRALFKHYIRRSATDKQKTEYCKLLLKINLEAFDKYVEDKDEFQAKVYLGKIRTLLSLEELHEFIPKRYLKADKQGLDFIERTADNADLYIDY